MLCVFLAHLPCIFSYRWMRSTSLSFVGQAPTNNRKLMKKCYVSVLISVVKLSFNKICRIPVNLVPAAAAKQVV